MTAATAHAIATIAYRDLLKFLREPLRIIGTLVFPVVFVVILGGSLESNLGDTAGYDFLAFTFTGVFAQTLFQSSALGIISLVADRENDFSQTIFIAPISRYAIVFGKILGESLVSMCQGIALLLLAVVVRVPMDLGQALILVPVGLVSCIFGGVFGIIILANLKNQRQANQVFGFVFLPQFFLAGVFAPIKELPLYLEVASRLTPLRYAVDFTRGLFYAGKPDRDLVVLDPLWLNAAVIASVFVLALTAGTALFVRAERNR
jgi:ABC-2 type transport system permease protein